MSHNFKTLVITLPFAVASIGCASRESAAVVQSPNAASAAASCDMRQDQKAIASMAGSYDVEFDFAETEVLTPGYQKKESHKSYATELVILTENTPGHVSLQHILQMGDGPSATIIKHWRQDWVFEDRELLEFRGKDIWERRTLPSDAVRCTWSQAVFGVEDAPRYDGYGRWTHDAAGSVWESNETWRPLPRREYTTRSDYDVLVAVNKHRIFAGGWAHEQENSKLVLEPRHFLVREHGKNSYTRAKPADTQVAAAYWQATSGFWQQVRAEWARVFASTNRLNLQSEASGKRLHEALFERANAKLPVDAATTAFIRDALNKYVVQASDAATAAAAP
jgi:hypothetical protein